MALGAVSIMQRFTEIYDVPRFWVQNDACVVGVYQALFPGGGAWGRGYVLAITMTSVGVNLCKSSSGNSPQL